MILAACAGDPETATSDAGEGRLALAAIYHLGGGGAPLGAPSAAGTRLAVEEANAAGGDAAGGAGL
ncbi:MAG: hypothetical protein ACR2HZ_09120 [Gemmatimonadaceae bacterium]